MSSVQLTPILEAEIRIHKLYRQMSVTTIEQAKYLRIAGQLAKAHASSTWYLSRALGEPCKDLRRDLRKMEGHGLVVAESNGSNNIYWSLKP
ncbi:hypothetical protein D3C84_683060 [compost metagenome]